MKMRRYLGFTLSEVLITLGVIGVVAAITMPTLIKNYQKQVTVNQLKKVYTELNQAYLLAESKHGEALYWDLSDTSSANNFKKYIDQIKIIDETTVGEVMSKRGITYKQLSGGRETGLGVMRDSSPVLTTSSGYQIFLSGIGGAITSPVVDINGFKGPNTFGKDLFGLTYYSSEHKMRAFFKDDGATGTFEERNRDDLLYGPSKYGYQCNKSGRGMWCAAVIIKDGWKISDDYPW